VVKNFSKVSFLFVALTVFICASAELVLFEIKYGFFTGGFLQAYPLNTLSKKIGFTLVFFVFNFLFYSLLFLLFKLIFLRFRPKNSTMGFNFFMIAGISTAVALTLQLQLHRYFADAMNAALIKDIAGGDLNTAIAYVSDELVLFGIGILILVGTYLFLNRVMRSVLVKLDDQKPTEGLHLVYLICLTSMILVPTTYFVNQYDTLRNNIRYSNAYRVSSNVLNDLSDFDNDGFGSFRYPFDAEITNPSIYPGALDLPGNGIDEDGLFGDFIFDPKTNTGENKELNKITSKKHVVIVVLESARADIRDKRIEGNLIAPNLNALSTQGSYFSETYSHTGYTSTSLSMLFSGNFGEFPVENSMFMRFKEAGYQVKIFSGQDETWGNLDVKLQTRESSHYFYDAQTGIEKRVFPSTLPSSIKLSEETLWGEFNRQLPTTNWNIPQFIYFNFQAAHFPYFHKFMTTNFVEQGIPRSEINIDNKDWLEKTYWNSLNYSDIYLGKIIADLKNAGVWDNTLLLVLGDHGEELFDQNHLGHGFLISAVQLNIPLITNQPNFQIPQPAGLIDVKQAIIRFLEDKPNPKVKQRQFVFQFIGSLSQPQKIALRFSQSEVVELDLQNMLVNLHHKNLSLPYDKALQNDEIKKMVKQLVDHWAHIRWKEKLANE